MKRYDALDPSAPLLGHFLLEASAGTGKTFAIEQIYVRLLKEEKLAAEQIVAVTFTRAAARDLRERIRRAVAKEGLKVDLERAHIDTIHRFCHRLLSEFGLEAGLAIDLPGSDQQACRDDLLKRVLAFLEEPLDLAPAQMGRLGALDKLTKKLLNRQLFAADVTFSSHCRFLTCPFPPSNEEERFASIQGCYYKKEGVETEVPLWVAFFHDPCPHTFAECLFREGKLFAHIDRGNLKKKFKGDPTPSPFLSWMKETYEPLVQKLIDREAIFATLQAKWKPVERKLAHELGLVLPDQILDRTLEALDRPVFIEAVRRKFEAAIIDEFQDTDHIQWQIFKKLFQEKPIRSLFLVGDPKQSIYQFRGADPYVYQQVRKQIELYSLDTNYRSAPALVEGLNDLFSEEHGAWLHLPKAGETIPYVPVRAGRTEGVGQLLFFTGDTEEDFFAYVAEEIGEGSNAVLTRNNSEMDRVVAYLQARSIPAVAKSRISIGSTPAFRALIEVFEAIEQRPPGAFRKVALGPFGQIPLEKEALFPHLIKQAELQGGRFYADFRQIIERLLRENRPEFLPLLRQWEDWESDEWPREAEASPEAVQVMTIHASKGLEFDTVFVLGLKEPIKKENEEEQAESMRLLYVALTRAKNNLHIALAAKEGADTPIERLLSRRKERPLARSASHRPPSLSYQAPVPPSRPSYSWSGKTRQLLSFTALAKPLEKEKVPLPEGALPSGALVGDLLHRILETYFQTRNLEKTVEEFLSFSPFFPWKETIYQMLKKILDTSLPGLGIKIGEIARCATEVEILFQQGDNWIKAVIDLLFEHQGKLYFLDWKSNLLQNYETETLAQEMKDSDYYLQASLYKQGLQNFSYGGAYYVFLRGPGLLRVD
jgi:exodeoxyribonuclease V beta subunit